jgi:hypothetical protein
MTRQPIIPLLCCALSALVVTRAEARRQPRPTPDRYSTATISPVRSPTPTRMPPESKSAILAGWNVYPARNYPTIVAEYNRILACMGQSDRGLLTDPLKPLQVTHLPARECGPWWNPAAVCCHDYWNNYCNFRCDGLMDYVDSNGVPQRGRVSGASYWTSRGPVIILPDSCEYSDGHQPPPPCSAMGWELITWILWRAGNPSWANEGAFAELRQRCACP